MAQSLGGRVDALVRALRAFEPGEYSGEDCALLVTKFARAEKALAAARARAAARAAESNQHRKEGFANPWEWLSRHHWDKTERDRLAGRHRGRKAEPRPPPRK